jgi:hypothetical protein
MDALRAPSALSQTLPGRGGGDGKCRRRIARSGCRKRGTDCREYQRAYPRRCPISQIGRLHALRRSTVIRRAVIGRCCPILSRRPGGQDLPLADLTGRFVQKRQKRRSQAGPALICGGLGRSSVMTILQKLLPSGHEHAARGWHRFGRGDQAVRDTEAWEHENFAEEQARWERSDPEYARICEEARQAKGWGEEPSRRADEAKAKWDARVATQRQASDDAQRAQHALNAEPTGRRRPVTSRTSSQRRKSRSLNSSRMPRLSARGGHHHMPTTFADLVPTTEEPLSESREDSDRERAGRATPLSWPGQPGVP